MHFLEFGYFQIFLLFILGPVNNLMYVTGYFMTSKKNMMQKEEVGVAIVGAPGVGKSTCFRELKRRFEVKSSSSLDLEPGTAILNIDDQIYRVTDAGSDFCTDTTVQAGIIHCNQVFIILHSLNDGDTFMEMVRIKGIIEDTKVGPCRVLVVGNKLDKRKRKSDSVTADCIITIDWGLKYVEIAAKFGLDIDKVVDMLNEEGRKREKSGSVGFIETPVRRRRSLVFPCYEIYTGRKSRRLSLPRLTVSKLLQRCTSRAVTEVN